MSGKTARLTSLESRKKLLLAESDLQRAHLVQEWQTMAGEVRALTDQARNLRTMAAATAILATGLISFVRPHAPAAAKPAWWQTILKGTGVAFTLWQAYARSKSAGKK